MGARRTGKCQQRFHAAALRRIEEDRLHQEQFSQSYIKAECEKILAESPRPMVGEPKGEDTVTAPVYPASVLRTDHTVRTKRWED